MRSEHAKFLFFFVTISLFFVSIFLRTNGLYERGQVGHDTYQYLLWSKILFSEEPFVLFYRPALYFVIFVFGSFLGWHDSLFSTILAAFGGISLIATAYIIYKTSLSYFTKLLVLAAVFTLPITWQSDIGNHLLSLDSGFFYCAIAMLVKDYDPKTNKIVESSKIWNAMIGLVFSFFIHLHEEKIILVVLLVAWLYFFHSKKKAATIMISLILISTLTLFYFGLLNVIANLGRIHISVSSNWPYYGLLFSNGIFIFLGFLYSSFNSVFLELGFLSIFCATWFSYLNKKALKNPIVPICCLFFVYVLFIGMAMGKIELYRIINFGLPLYLIWVGFALENLTMRLSKINQTTIILVVFLTQLFPNLFTVAKALTVDPQISSARLAYELLEPEIKEDQYVLMGNSFEKRTPMWGDYEGYSLQSVVYLGDQARSLVNLKNPKSRLSSKKQKKEHVSDFEYFVINRAGSEEDVVADLKLASNFFRGKKLSKGDIEIYFRSP